MATVTRTYRDLLDRLRRGDFAPATPEQNQSLVQIFSRGFTGGMLGGRAGRSYVTRTHADNRGAELGTVVACGGGELTILVRAPLRIGDGVGLEPPERAAPAASRGFTVAAVRTIGVHGGMIRQAVRTHEQIPVGWTVIRGSGLRRFARLEDPALPEPS